MPQPIKHTVERAKSKDLTQPDGVWMTLKSNGQQRIFGLSKSEAESLARALLFAVTALEKYPQWPT